MCHCWLYNDVVTKCELLTFSATSFYEESFWNWDTIRPHQNEKTDNCSLVRNVWMFCFSRLCHQAHGFFKGMSLPLTTVTLTSSMSFGTYRNCLQWLSQVRRGGSGPNTKLEVFLSGMAGGIAQVTHATPQTDWKLLNRVKNVFHYAVRVVWNYRSTSPKTHTKIRV